MAPTTPTQDRDHRPWSSPQERRRILARLLPIAPSVLRDDGPAARRAVQAAIEQAEASEAARRAAGHWSASALRLDALQAAAQAEAAEGDGPAGAGSVGRDGRRRSD